MRQPADCQTPPDSQSSGQPNEPVTRGVDRSAPGDLIYPGDMTGLSLLDVGCRNGELCIEACKRGATDVTGVDFDHDALDQGRRIAEQQSCNVQFRRLDIEHEEIDRQYDYVLCLNLMHRFKNPITVLDRLLRSTRRRLILELSAFTRLDRRRLGMTPLIAWILRCLPVLYACPANAENAAHSTGFSITPAAVGNMFQFHRSVVANVQTIPSTRKSRRLVIADKRRFDRVVVFAGPASIGKSTLIEQLAQGRAAHVAERLALGDLKQWRQVEAAKLRRINEPYLPRVLFHYNMLSSRLRGIRPFERDERLDPLALAQKVTFVTLWTTPQVYRRRFDQVKIDPNMRNEQFAGPEYFLEMRSLIEDHEELFDYYRKWFDYVREKGAESLIIDNTEQEPSLISFTQWEQRARTAHHESDQGHASRT